MVSPVRATVDQDAGDADQRAGLADERAVFEEGVMREVVRASISGYLGTSGLYRPARLESHSAAARETP
jgi:hypothetical protein